MFQGLTNAELLELINARRKQPCAVDHDKCTPYSVFRMYVRLIEVAFGFQLAPAWVPRAKPFHTSNHNAACPARLL